jgi:uncharacterized protein with FMN-binding domain
MKIRKKVLTGLGIPVVIIVILGIAYSLRFRQMVKRIDSVIIEDIDLKQIADGMYAGEFEDFLVKAQLEVTVQDHRITNIRIIDQRSSGGHEALEIIDRIIKAQSPKVDVVSGATGSSRCIMIAVQNALKGQNQ